MRLALFGKNWEPPAILGGKAFGGRAGGPDADAGLMFYNDARSEIGGLIFGLHRGASGKLEQGQSLTFDAYEQDQVLQLLHDRDGGIRTTGIIVNDPPALSLERTISMFERASKLPNDRRAAAIGRLRDEGYALRRRFFAGVRGGDATIVLRDGSGRPRLRLAVDPRGTQKIEFLDARGAVVRTIGP